MTKFLIQEEIKSYEQYFYTNVEDKQFFLGVPEINAYLPLTQNEEQYLQNEPFHQFLTSDNEEDYDADQGIEDYLSSNDKTVNDKTIENLDITNDEKSEKINNQVANFSLNTDKNAISSINSVSKSQQKTEHNNTIRQNIFSKSHINTDESTFELRKNNHQSSLIKLQQDDQVQFNIIPHYNSEQSIHSSLKEPQQFQYTKQQSSQSVKFSQNQVYNNQSQANKDQLIQQLQQGQHQNQQLQQSLPQVLNYQILKLICQAMQLQQSNQSGNQGNNISNNQSSHTMQQPAGQNIRRPSYQRTKTRKDTHKKSVTIMRYKTFKQTIQPILQNAQNITQVDSHQLDSQQKQRQQQFYFFDFEKIKNMVKYFPKYNLQNVINIQNKYFKLRMNSIRKSIKKENNVDNRSPTFIGRPSIQQGLSPTRKRKEQRSNAINSPFQIRCKQVKQTIVLQN
ncbi:cyclic nucleotide-binding domain protein (macronuclear) [Tetrahymena thermophila SB210]|uniref:Cyclic nucleotide-binding domain protein n=1 Tax=Tetrahymena thermophila (strain SB210) TaxID=312017 RepID=W7XHG8_TETTS|nr:cyclic nucleotide-binding domain protein [Tetrahymena thermophila SB210]EWS73796.1 cyclic nucleotide-binding domain protein [Tetrahymena thermophila SB210]|eukprot:XP_012653676.1 cyclic nucleotide-binding domain protein [Tetrahymena thermophila SB210]